MIVRELRDTISLLRFDHGKVSALDTEFLEALTAALERELGEDTCAVVLTGTGSAFSAGVDLRRIVDEGEAYLDRFLPALDAAFERLFTFPLPVVAAVNGHAIAGGCVIVCAADHRILAEGSARIGLTELLVGVPFPPLALEIVRFAVARQALQAAIYSGATFDPETALRHGFVDELSPPESLIERACDRARAYAAVLPRTFSITKQQLRHDALESRRRLDLLFAPQIVEQWRRPEVLATLQAFLERTVSKG